MPSYLGVGNVKTLNHWLTQLGLKMNIFSVLGISRFCEIPFSKLFQNYQPTLGSGILDQFRYDHECDVRPK